MRDPLFIDVHCSQEKKFKQNAYGDCFLSKRYPEEGRLIGVLSDGLGSGVKANILSSMTATMLLKFIAAGRDLKKASEVVMDSLPVCQVRKISYSTFSVIDCNDDGYARIVEEGNPQFLWIRDMEVLKPECTTVTSKKFKNRHMHTYEIQLEPNDRLIFCSDGVTQSGLGNPEYKLGWRRDGLIEFVTAKLRANPTISSSKLSELIVQEARRKEVDKKAKDDISSVVLYFRKPRELLIFTGPPYDASRDNEYAQILDVYDGKKAICGGTTANLVARELNREITSDLRKAAGNLPACSFMDGMDLITEGVLTLTKTVEYLENGNQDPNDAAGKLMNLLLDSDCINFMVGAKLNQAHYDPDLPLELELRKNIVKKMAKTLEEKYIKKVTLQFI
ncbi:MAG: SpoIIE family protein phosphatase [Candidatus Gastranaerophilales bacterium]|nr:SpoIIE family protein phosphatase [Candidatus Gastranaerophilales bacterium]